MYAVHRLQCVRKGDARACCVVASIIALGQFLIPLLAIMGLVVLQTVGYPKAAAGGS